MELKYTIDYYNGNILFYPHELQEKLKISLEDCKNVDNNKFKQITKLCRTNNILSPLIIKNNLVTRRIYEGGNNILEFEKESNELCSGLTEIYIPKGYLYQFKIIKRFKGLELLLTVSKIIGKYGSHIKTCRYFAYDKFEIYLKD